jgi:hypothetical protein
MSRTVRQFDCSPADVFSVLSDGWSYATWVVGAARIRDVDADWPAPGSSIHHSVGFWPLLIHDHTDVEAVQEPHLLQLIARAWPTGEARVLIRIEPVAGDPAKSLVSIEEDAVSGPSKLIPPPLIHPMLKARNNEALRRLAYLAEGRSTSRT